jgi:hypothetical protein
MDQEQNPDVAEATRRAEEFRNKCLELAKSLDIHSFAMCATVLVNEDGHMVAGSFALYGCVASNGEGLARLVKTGPDDGFREVFYLELANDLSAQLAIAEIAAQTLARMEKNGAPDA